MPKEGPLPLKFMEPSFSRLVCVPIVVSLNLDAHMFRDGGEISRFHNDAIGIYGFVGDDGQQSDAAGRDPRSRDILLEGFHFSAIQEMAFIRPGRKMKAFFKPSSLLKIGGKST